MNKKPDSKLLSPSATEMDGGSSGFAGATNLPTAMDGGRKDDEKVGNAEVTDLSVSIFRQPPCHMKFSTKRKLFVMCASTFFLFFYNTSWALDWNVSTGLNLEEIYSDNIRLSDANKKSAFVTEVSPSISINGASARSRFDLNYRMQNLYNARGEEGLEINNQLQMNSKYEFYKKRLFLDSSASISQQNVSNRRIASDNISGSEDSTTVNTFLISPYWTPHFNGFADAEFRATYDRVEADEGNSELSETNSFSQNVRINSGRYFSLFSWFLSFNNSVRSNSDSEDVEFQDSQAEIRYAISREFSVFARVGHSSNSFASNSSSNNNGTSYTFGGQWRPSQRFSVEAGYGNNNFVTVEIRPFNRLHWITTYRNNDIGTNTGDTWNTELNYYTRRSDWRASYSEQTLTTQQLLLEQQIFSVPVNTTDSQGNIIDTQDIFFNVRLPTLTDEVFISKTAQISVSFRTGKSDISAEIFKTIRTFELSQNDEEVTGVSASWNWQFLRRTSSIFRSRWQITESDGVDAFSDKRFDVSVALRRNILARLNGTIEYRFVDQQSDDNLNSYSENRVTASLSLRF